jgi:putative ABC transport system permease protein
MWRNYLTIALRTLGKHRLFAALNIGGLAAGMAACLLISMWVRNETTYDQWIPDSDRVFVVQGKTQYPGRASEIWGGSSAMLLPALKEDYPQIVAGTRLFRSERAFRLGERVESQAVVLADEAFFDVFALPIVAGAVADALKVPENIAVSERFAKNWFGSVSPIGQTLMVTVRGEKRAFRIGVVFKDIPANSMLEFDVVTLFNENDLTNRDLTMQWGNFGGITAVKLQRASDAQTLLDSADAFIGKHVPDFLKVENGFFYRPQLKVITETHLQSPPVNAFFRPPGDPRLVAVLAATGFLILIIAAITYVNLATARVSLRAREVGLRKTLGAGRWQLMLQFLFESSLLAILAGVLALAIVELTLPLFNLLLAQKLELSYDQYLLLPLVAMVGFVGILGGWYPALVLARLRPRAAITGQHIASGGGLLRQGLVVSQFAVAVLLMGCMAIIYAQVSHLRSADMGYQPEGLIVVTQLQRKEVVPLQKNLLDAFRRVPGVVSATRSTFDPTGGGMWRQQAFMPGVPDSQAPQISVQPIDWDYVSTYGGKLLAGRDLSESNGGDDTPEDIELAQLQKRGVNALINRTALKLFNVAEPQAALGKTFAINAGPNGERVTITVVGVIEDIRMRSARDKIEPAYYSRNVGNTTSIAVRFRGVAPSEMRSRLELAWKQLLPDTPLRLQPVEEAIDAYYQAEARRGNLFALFAGIAIVLCALGLYGLAVFTAQRRTKEIGIRRVLGASSSDVARLLLWEFSRPILVAIAIAAPLAWWLMRDWLNGFELRIALTPWPFVLAALIAMAIAWLTVGWHAIKSSRANPIDALRYE